MQMTVVLRSAWWRAELPHRAYPGHVCLRLGAQPRVSRSLTTPAARAARLGLPGQAEQEGPSGRAVTNPW